MEENMGNTTTSGRSYQTEMGKRHMDKNIEPPSPEHILELFTRLDLGGEITFADFLRISMHHQEASTDKDICYSFLQRLLTANYNARYISVTEESTLIRDQENSFSTFLKKNNQAEVRKSTQIHPMDVQMAVFHRADHFLKQLIVTKLSQCQYALPLLVPNPFTQEIEFPLWTFQQIKKSWKTTNTKGEVISKSQSIYKVETPMVAFFRLGSVSSSKSQLMNSLINEKHNTFFHRNCTGSSRTRLLMDGVVEIAWYCPSGKGDDIFTDCVAFCNLHGDAEVNPLQRKIVTEMATINVVLLSELNENDNNVAIVEELFKSPKPFICVFTEDEDPIIEVGKGNYRIGLKGRNQSDVSKELSRAIRQNLSEGTLSFKLVNVSDCQEVKVDTESEECRSGRDAALEIMQLLKGKDILQLKEAYLPRHGQLWHDWSQKNKDLHQSQKGKHCSELENLEDSIGIQKQEMRKIRHQQQATGLSELIRLFVKNLKSLSIPEKKYFLKWVGSLLDDFTSEELSAIYQEYEQKWGDVLSLKNAHDESKQLEAEQTNLGKISAKLNAATFGLEHIWREIGQVYESWKDCEGDKFFGGSKDMDVLDLPIVAAKMMISGHPMELMDGDAAHVPLVWLTAVLDEVIKIVGDQRVFVLSVLGLQSSGKSTMLNAMFGLQFAVSAGRCTKGAFMQLVKVSEEMKAELKFDFILIVDTEGLRALELAEKVVHHDNELATFVVGVGNMTLINIFGENPCEMQDILQIVVQTFLRMKKVRLNPSCMFVHQNVTDVTAGEKNLEGRRRLQEKLDMMTKLAAKEEVCDAECFSDVIAFDIQKDVKYFAQLWEGSPPMAPPNPSYSENVQELKNTILSYASKSKRLTLTEFKCRLQDLWHALLNEDFVLSFKNTLEIAAYRALEDKYCKWTWNLRGEMLNIEDQLHNTINSNKIDYVNKSMLVVKIKMTLQKVEEEMKQYFETDKDKDILIQWKAKFELKIKELHDELVEKASTKLRDVISQRAARKKMDEEKEQHEMKLFEKSKELALKLQHNGNDEEQLKTEFNSMWRTWVSELTKDIVIRDVNIKQDVIKILSEIHEVGLVHDSKSSEKYKTIRNVNDFSEYVTVTRSFADKARDYASTIIGIRKSEGLTSEDQISIRDLINKIAWDIDELVKTKRVSEMGYNSGHIQELAHEVKNMVKNYKSKKTKFEFKKPFEVEVSLYMCVRAADEFVKLHEAFREANNPHIYLEKKKQSYYHVFQKFCEGATCAVVLGGLICTGLRDPILRSAYNNTATDISTEMHLTVPALKGNRANMDKLILKCLAEKEDFQHFIMYIDDPREYMKRFIMNHVANYMSECTTGDVPRVLTMIIKKVDDLQKFVIIAAETATNEIKAGKGDADATDEVKSDKGNADATETATNEIKAGKGDADATDEVKSDKGNADATDEVKADKGNADATETATNEIKAGKGDADATDEVKSDKGNADATDEVKADKGNADATETATNEIKAGKGDADATDEVKADKGNAEVWLQSFSKSLSTVLEYSTDHLSGENSRMKELKDVKEFDLLVDLMKKEISPVIEGIHKSLRGMSDLNMKMFRKSPDEILIEHFCQCCWERCPFCYATCDNTIKGHAEQHMVRFHHSPAIHGITFTDTDKFSLGFCSTEIMSSHIFSLPDLTNAIPFKDYKTQFKQWDITPDLSQLPYWKWFVCRFQKDLEKLYNKKFESWGKIPDEWSTYTKEKAIASLDEYI